MLAVGVSPPAVWQWRHMSFAFAGRVGQRLDIGDRSEALPLP